MIVSPWYIHGARKRLASFSIVSPNYWSSICLSHPTLLQLLPPCSNSSLECVYHQRDSLFIGHPIELRNLFSSQYLIHKFFKLWISLEFWNMEFESTHLPIGMSLHKVLMSVHSTLCKRVSRSTPFVTTQIGNSGSEVFNLIPHSLELVPLYCPHSALDLSSTSTNRSLGWWQQPFGPSFTCHKQIAGCSLRVVFVRTCTSFMPAKWSLLLIHGK